MPDFFYEGNNQERFDKDGYDRNGYDKRGYDRDGYNRMGRDALGYDREGNSFDGFDNEYVFKHEVEKYDENGYDQEGYDREGFNREGYNREGWDRDGYNDKGYNREGWDKDGYNERGYNRSGFDSAGYDSKGMDSQRYDRRGFNIQGLQRDGQRYDKNGYDIHGFDKEGFNRRGLTLYGYNRLGYTLDGYDKAGFDLHGFSRDGFYRDGGRYDEQGFSADDLSREGGKRFDVNGYDVNGFDKTGYNREGFDNEGYDRAGFDKDGYDRNGFDLNGYDVNGFDCNHRCICGEYNQNGYDYMGFDKDGYNVRGFNKEGEHRTGKKYDENGYDFFGYSSSGYDMNGYNREGYDMNGYDINGYKYGKYNHLNWTAERNYKGGGRFDEKGFDIEGYNRYGLNADGIDRDGFDIFGYDIDKMNYIGCDVYGANLYGEALVDIDEDGINLYTGCNRWGFYRSGYNCDGYDIDGYDREGYDIKGYDKNGYNRQGYNIKGYDQDGYDSDGFNVSGYDRGGYDKDGYNSSGYDSEGFNREGYAANGFNRSGYDKDGYDISGYDKNGYDKNGIDRAGLSLNDLKERQKKICPSLVTGMIFTHQKYGRGEIIGFDCDKKIVKVDFDDLDSIRYISDEEVFFNMSFGNLNNTREQAQSYDAKDDKRERDFFAKVMNYIEKEEDARTWESVYAKNRVRNVVSFEGDEVIHSYEAKYDNSILYNEIMAEAKRSPYFCHIDYKENHDLYIGKKGYPEYIVDWADPRASYYYQYNIYVEKQEFDMRLVRDIDIENGYYFGYRDKYNKDRPVRNYNNLSRDGHLARIIEANQGNKRVHDIIQTIQNNQYDIITSDSSKNAMVLGCAGSGKTMILLHKIRYMKYNESSLDMKKVIVVSPTDLLGRESKELSRILQISDVQQYTMEELLFSICKHISREKGIKLNYILSDRITTMNTSFGNVEAYRTVATVTVPDSQENIEFVASEKRRLHDEVEIVANTVIGNVTVKEAYMHYPKVKAEVRKYTKSFIDAVILRGKRLHKELPIIQKQIAFYEWLLAKECFHSAGKAEGILLYSKQIAECLDMKNLNRRFGDKKFTGYLEILHAVTCFCEGKQEQEVLEGIIKEWRSTSKECVRNEVFRLRSLQDRISGLPSKLYILEELNKQDVFEGALQLLSSVGDNEVYECATEIVNLFNFIGWKASDDNPLRILEHYDRLLDKERRFNSFLKTKDYRVYMEEIINYCYGLKSCDVNGMVALEKNYVYQICKELCALFQYRDNCKHIFIDEFQDFTANIILFLKTIYPEATFHLFGDFRQCINDSGMTSEKCGELSCFDFKTYQIMENYRNAKGITEYVNSRFGLEMLAIGLKGEVVISEDIFLQTLEKGDRAAIIVADEEVARVVYEKLKRSNDNIPVFNFCETREIRRDGYNILPVIMAKGLEFECVISVEHKMTENQKYVSATRAIRYLQVVQSDIEEK